MSKINGIRKKELVAEYKQQTITGGIYRIFNKETEKSLIKGDINLEADKNRLRREAYSEQDQICILDRLVTYHFPVQIHIHIVHFNGGKRQLAVFHEK